MIKVLARRHLGAEGSGKLPYLLEEVDAGRVREVRKKYSARYHIKGIPRGDNHNPTPEDVEKVNQENAERKLRWIINANYQAGDFHAIAGFDGNWNPTQGEAMTAYAKFIRKARELYRKNGRSFQYVAAMERGQRGEHKIHFHLVIPYLDTRKISEIWPWGRIRYFPLDNSGQYAKIASYIIKRTSKTFRAGEGFKKRYNSSTNLIIPVPKNTIVSREKWMLDPRPVKGYYIEKDKTYNGISERTGYPVQFYSMVMLQPCIKARRRI